MTLSASPSNAGEVRAWDLPTRVFKWTLVFLVICAPISTKVGDVMMTWHRWNGMAIVTLLVWRVLWGVAGSTTARFATFVRPLGAFGYARDLLLGRTRKFLGHNPLGGLMVLALLAAVATQATAGMFTSDDIVVDGPLVAVAPVAWEKLASRIHHNGFLIIASLAIVHVAAVFWYRAFRNENLIGPMVFGAKPAGAYEDARETRGGSVMLALALLGLAVVLVFGGLWAVGGRM
jgi:cytochrome b